MKKSWNIINYFDSLSSIKGPLLKEDESGGEVFIELRVSFGDLIVGDFEVEIGFNEVSLSMDLEGYDIRPGERYGENLLPHSSSENVTTTRARGEDSEKNCGVAGKLESTGPGLSGSHSGSTKTSQLSQSVVSRENVYRN